MKGRRFEATGRLCNEAKYVYDSEHKAIKNHKINKVIQYIPTIIATC